METLITTPEAIVLGYDAIFEDRRNAELKALNAVQERAMKELGLLDLEFRDVYNRAVEGLGEFGVGFGSKLAIFNRLLELVGIKTQVDLALEFEQTFWQEFLLNARLAKNVAEFLTAARRNQVPLVLFERDALAALFRILLFVEKESVFDFVIGREELQGTVSWTSVVSIVSQKIRPQAKLQNIWFIDHDDAVSQIPEVQLFLRGGRSLSSGQGISRYRNYEELVSMLESNLIGSSKVVNI